MTRLLAIATVACLAGCKSASLTDMRPGFSGELQCWLTLNFKRAPKGDVRDVKVTFSSIVLTEEQSFDWEYIVTHDHKEVVEKTWLEDITKYVPDDATTAEQDPPIGGAMKTLFKMPSKHEVKAQSYGEVVLDATLYWGGVKQDAMTRGLFLAYQKK